MDMKDFDKDVREFRQQLGERRIDVRQAKQYLEAIALSWATTSQERLGGIVSITLDTENSRFDGEVLGKKFCIHYAPIGLEGDVALEAALSIRDLITGDAIELSRFLVTFKGGILSLDGKELVNLDNHGDDFKLLVAVASRVINASSRA